MSIKLVPGGKQKNRKKSKPANASEQSSAFKKRLPCLLIIFAVLFTVLIGRVFWLTVVNGQNLKKLAVSQWTRSTAQSAQRGMIVDCNGVELAVNTQAYKVVIWPSAVKPGERERIASELSSLLGVSREKILEKLSNPNVREYTVKRQLDEDTVNKVRSLQLGKGVGIAQDIKRYYPYGTLLSQVIGFTNIDSAGQSGLELVLDKYLTGRDGKVIAETDSRGNPIAGSSYQYIEAADGDTARLTVDVNFQSYLENALEEAILVNNAKDAQGIILDVRTGAIKAISTKPDFDPNDPPRNDLSALAALSKNRVVTDAYEPGSTFKILTLAAAIDSGCANTDSGFYCNGGYIVNGERIKCWKHAGHGSQSLTEATENSCNVCFMQLALSMGTEQFYDYLYAFGLGQSTGSGLVGESDGIVTHQKYITANDLARIGFGQSIAVTPIQLASAVAAAVNGGELHTPYIIEEITAADGTVIFKADTTPVRRVISEESSKEVCRILQSVVDNGTGRNAKIEGYAIGGKTGTAQKYDSYGRVAEGSYICSFIGFAPADEPRYLVLILVDEPHVGSIFGSTVAAPYVRRVLSQILPYANIPKTGYNAEGVEVPNVTGMSMEEAVAALEAVGLIGVYECDSPVTFQVPAAGERMPYGSSVLLYTGNEGINPEPDEPYYVEMPNLMGMTPLQAYTALRNAGLVLEPNPADPYGVVIGQSIPAGDPVEYGSSVTVYFDWPTPTPAPSQTAQPEVTPSPAVTQQPAETPAPTPAPTEEPNE